MRTIFLCMLGVSIVYIPIMQANFVYPTNSPIKMMMVGHKDEHQQCYHH